MPRCALPASLSAPGSRGTLVACEVWSTNAASPGLCVHGRARRLGELHHVTRTRGARRPHHRNDQVEMDTEGSGNVMAKLYDVAPDGSAVTFDEQVAIAGASGHVAVGLKSTRLAARGWAIPGRRDRHHPRRPVDRRPDRRPHQGDEHTSWPFRRRPCRWPGRRRQALAVPRRLQVYAKKKLAEQPSSFTLPGAGLTSGAATASGRRTPWMRRRQSTNRSVGSESCCRPIVCTGCTGFTVGNRGRAGARPFPGPWKGRP